MRGYPTIEEIVELHKKYAPSELMFELVFTHCLAVRDIAADILLRRHVPLNTHLLGAGCLLHDIGVYQLKLGITDTPEYLMHGTLGEEILRAEGFPEEICRFASHHTGIGLTKEEIERDRLPLPHKDFFAETLEEALVMYADKFHSKTDPLEFNTAAYYKRYTERFGERTVKQFEAFIEKFGEPDVVGLAKKYHQPLRV
jgi:uncharacterized protein